MLQQVQVAVALQSEEVPGRSRWRIGRLMMTRSSSFLPLWLAPS